MVNATVFTTLDATSAMKRLRDAVYQDLPPGQRDLDRLTRDQVDRATRCAAGSAWIGLVAVTALHPTTPTSDRVERGALLARGRLTHSYPHSWRSRAPVIFRATPQWFIRLDQKIDGGRTLREYALDAIDVTKFTPPTGRNRLRAMVEGRPDWLISRQRAWGTPIPMIYCEKDGIVAVPEGQLPVRLPDDAEYLPTGKSPLARHEGFVNVICPKCGEPARRETDTMDTFMDSNWYFIRYLSPDYDQAPVDPKLAEVWLPVDQYSGGAEHAVMHLLYARFFWKVARDLGVVKGPEPFLRLFNQGQILGPDGQRMSKSRGNVVAPDDQVAKWGADCFRCYLMFIGPWEDGGPFRIDGISGLDRWLNRAWNLVVSEPAFGDADPAELRRLTHKTLRRVTEDYNGFRWNTALSAQMEFVNGLSSARNGGPVHRDAWNDAVEKMVLMMAPVAPHIAEELWERSGHKYSVHTQQWPAWDAALAKEDEITLVVQVNGRLRDRISAPADITEADATELALASAAVQKHLEGKTPKLVKYVPGKLVNIVV